MQGFSIIICCYNSAEIIEETLHHLAVLQAPAGYKVEVILVNNLCTDDTCPLSLRTWEELHSPFVLKIVNEDRPGLSYARKRGINSSSYEYILFCDDDNRLDRDYLQIATSILNKNPRIGVMGGLGTPDYENMPDYWSADFYIYGSGPQAKESGIVPYVHGAGMIIRREAYEKVQRANLQFLLTDRKGEQLTSGGDYELCYTIGLAGYKMWYEKNLTFRHFITTDRVTREYCWRFIRESAPAIDILDVYYYLLKNNTIRIGFYIQRCKLIFYHLYKVIYCHINKSRYIHEDKIVFLENFHIRFHKARIRGIATSIFKYRVWAGQIAALKRKIQSAEHRIMSSE